jgi:hypothetical protein
VAKIRVDIRAPFLGLDVRDRLGLLIAICKTFNSHATTSEICISHHELQEIDLLRLMGFIVTTEARVTGHNIDDSIFLTVNEVESAANRNQTSRHLMFDEWFVLADNELRDELKIDYPVFFKLTDSPDRIERLGGISRNFFCYVSGHCNVKPLSRAQVIAPAWDWVDNSTHVMSGINFLGELREHCDHTCSAADKKYRCVYVGSSSLNKMAPFALILLALSRTGGGSDTLPDVFLCFRFYGWKGSLVWRLLQLQCFLINLFNVKIKVLLSQDKFDKSEIESYMCQSYLGLVPYLREGFPRVIGDFMLNKCEPVVLDWMSYGGREFEELADVKYHLISAFVKLREAKSVEALNDRLYKKAMPFFYPKRRLSKFFATNRATEDLREHLRYIHRNAVAVSVYTFLTKDLTWQASSNKRRDG